VAIATCCPWAAGGDPGRGRGRAFFPHIIGDALVGLLEQSSRFLKPVYCGDTLYPMLEVERAEAWPDDRHSHTEAHHP